MTPRLFHGTPTALPIGTVLVPGGPDGSLTNGGRNTGAWVWLTESASDAIEWASGYDTNPDGSSVKRVGHAYEVDTSEARPSWTGFEPDDPNKPIGSYRMWVAPTARIIAEVGPRGGRKTAAPKRTYEEEIEHFLAEAKASGKADFGSTAEARAYVERLLPPGVEVEVIVTHANRQGQLQLGAKAWVEKVNGRWRMSIRPEKATKDVALHEVAHIWDVEENGWPKGGGEGIDLEQSWAHGPSFQKALRDIQGHHLAAEIIQRHALAERYYHATTEVLPVGTVLTHGGPTGDRGNFPNLYRGTDSWRDREVWVSTKPGKAAWYVTWYAKEGEQIHVYEVEPHGDLYPDPEPTRDQGRSQYAFSCETATVLSEVTSFTVDAALKAHAAKTAAISEGAEKTVNGFRLVYMTMDLGERKPRHHISAYAPDGRLAGTLNWYGTTGMVHAVDVKDEWRRQGVATSMWEWSQEARPKAKHSADRTNEGDQWARSVGGPLPRRNTAARGIVTEDVPLDYPQYGDPLRFAVYFPEAGSSTQGYFDKAPGLVAFADTFTRGGETLIAYMSVRRDHRGKGLARKLVQEIYEHFDGPIDWGEVVEPEAGTLWKSFSERYPDRGNHGKQRYRGSLRTQALAPMADEIREHLLDLDLPEQARDGDCLPVSGQVHACLTEHGWDAHVVFVTGYGDFMGQRVVLWAHVAVEVEGRTMVDATATQYDRSLPSLMIETPERYREMMAEATGAAEVEISHAGGRTAALTPGHRDNGRYGRQDHITFEESGTIPIEVVRDMPGQAGEIPHDHRNKKGEDWERFKAEVAPGLNYGIFIMVNVGEPIRIWEGNHRRDAAVELGWDEIPVQIRYTGLAEQDGTLLERWAKGGRWMDGYVDKERLARDEEERRQRYASKTASLVCEAGHGVYEREHVLRAELGDRIKTSREACQNFLRRILKSEGVENAENAYIEENYADPGRSMIGMDHDGFPPTPFVLLGSMMMDTLTVVHEAAHIVELRRRGTWSNQGRTTDEAHDAGFIAVFDELLRKWMGKGLPPATGSKTEAPGVTYRIQWPIKMFGGPNKGGRVEAFDLQGSRIGNFAWTLIAGAPSAEIGNVEVDPEYQRQGIATEMLKRARKRCPVPIVHSTRLTPDGKGWSQAVGAKTASGTLYWHASPAVLTPGTVLVPSGDDGPKNHSGPPTPGREDDKNWVWMGDTDAVYGYALKLSIRGKEPHLYLVRALDSVEHRSFDWQPTPVTKRAEVVEVFPGTDWERDVRTHHGSYLVDGKTLWDGKGRMEAWKRSIESGAPIEKTSAQRTAATWFHGTQADLPVGEVLVPANERGGSNYTGLYSDPGEEWRGEWVWITDDPEDARIWSLYGPGATYKPGSGHVYEVEPVGEVVNGTRTPKARIVRKVSAAQKVRAWRGVHLHLDYDEMTSLLTAVRDKSQGVIRQMLIDARPLGEWWSLESVEPKIYAGEFMIHMNGDGEIPVVFEADIEQGDRDPEVEATGYQEWQKPVCPRPGSTVAMQAVWLRIPDSEEAIAGVASAMETLEQPRLGRGEWVRILMGISATASGPSQVTIDGVSYVWNPMNDTVTALIERDGGRVSRIGGLELYRWRSDEDYEIAYVEVDTEHRRRGIASKMLEYARAKAAPFKVSHSQDLTADGEAWSQKVAGPGSGVIPMRVRAEPPANPRRPRPVVIDPVANGDIRDLDQKDQKRVRQIIKRIERGEVEMERKQRPPLQDCFTVDVGYSLRLLMYLNTDGAWHIAYAGYHDYDEAERRMVASLSSAPDLLEKAR